MYTLSGIASAAACCLLFTSAPQQAAKVTTTNKTGFTLEAGEHDLVEVVNKAARFLGKNMLIEAAEFRGQSQTIELQKTMTLDALGCEEVVSQLCYSRGVVMTPVDEKRGIYEFVQANGQRRHLVTDRSLCWQPSQILRRSKLRVRVTTTIPTEFLDAMQITNYLRPLFAGRGYPQMSVSSLGSQSLIVTGWVDEVARLIEVVRSADTEKNGVASQTMRQGPQNLQVMQTNYNRVSTRLKQLETEIRNLRAGKQDKPKRNRK